MVIEVTMLPPHPPPAASAFDAAAGAVEAALDVTVRDPRIAGAGTLVG